MTMIKILIKKHTITLERNNLINVFIPNTYVWKKNACLIKFWGEIVNAIKYHFHQKPLWYQLTCLFNFETVGTPRLHMCRNVFAKKCGFKKAYTQVLSYENILEKIKQLQQYYVIHYWIHNTFMCLLKLEAVLYKVLLTYLVYDLNLNVYHHVLFWNQN